MGRTSRTALLTRELPTRDLVAGRAVLDNPHRSEGPAIKTAANRRPLLVDGAALFSQVHAGPVGAPPEHQLASDVPFGH